MVKKLSCVSNGSLKRFPHTFTTVRLLVVYCQNPGIFYLPWSQNFPKEIITSCFDPCLTFWNNTIPSA